MSCEKDFPVSEYIEKDKLVFNCLLPNDSTMVFSLGKTLSPFSPGDKFLDFEKAEIVLTDKQSNKIDFVRSGISNVFVLIDKLRQDSIYNIIVKYPGFKNVYSDTYLPQPVRIVDYSGNIEVNDESIQVLRSQFTVNPSCCKYIIMRHIIEKKIVSLSGDTIAFSDTTWITKVSQNLESILPGNAVNTVLFAKLKPNVENAISFDSYDGFDKNENLIEGTSCFELISCSEDYYKYVSTKILSDWNKRNDNNSTILPVSIYSNIENGYGIFAGFSTVIHRVKFK